MKNPKVRVLVVSDSADSRRHLGILLYELIADVYWQIELRGVVDFAGWCKPQLVILAMRDAHQSFAIYEALSSMIEQTPTRVAMLGAPDDGTPFPHRDRLKLDSYVSAVPTLHELAWLVQQCGAQDAGSPHSLHSGTRA